MKIELIVLHPKTDREIIELNLPAVLGRGAEVDLVIPHPEISRKHCRLFLHQDMVHVQDLQSLNGTQVGETQLRNAQCVILPGEHFTIGPVTFEIQYTKSEPRAVANDASSRSAGSTG